MDSLWGPGPGYCLKHLFKTLPGPDIKAAVTLGCYSLEPSSQDTLMNFGFRLVAKYLLGLDRANRNFEVYADDTFVVSYPRSGSTWTRFLVANLVWPEETVTFANLDRLVPATAAVSSRSLKRVPRPRIIKCHNYFDHRYQNVIYIVRDPRDVVLSEYRYVLKDGGIPDGYPMERFVERFIKGDVNEYSSWKESVGTWLAARGDSERFLLLRYEDMVEHTARELEKIAKFLKIEAGPERLALAVERSSADRMRTLEVREGDHWVVTKGKRKDIFFVGKAKAGIWQSSLPKSCVAQIENAWGPLMAHLGYELTCGGVGLEAEPLFGTVETR
jgi:hypothetical protein